MARTQQRNLLWSVLRSLLMLLSFLAVSTAQAQTNEVPPALTVTIRDTNDQGIDGVLVRVTNRSGGHEFARVTTDMNGQALIATLPTGEVRVKIEGEWNGLVLTQTGADAEGVLLLGGDPPLTLDLRVTSDGQVIPDPTTMIAPDLAGPQVPIPTAPVAATVATARAEEQGLSELTTPISPAGAGAAEGIAPVTTSDERRSTTPELHDDTTLWLVGACVLIAASLLILALRWGRPA